MMRPRKRFGQNFLVDSGVIYQIIDAISPQADERIIEIGPGRGALTAPLLKSGCDLTVIEIDRDVSHWLAEQFPGLDIREQDVLDVDFGALVAHDTRIVGNLPYNISTPLLFRLYPHMARIRDMHFMLQREVVDRMTAEPSTGDYSRLSVMTRYACDADKLFEVPPEAFRPSPRVTSAIVRLRSATHGEVVRDFQRFEQLVTQAFNQRRKTVRNSLKGFVTAEQIDAAGIDPGLRAENLTLADFVRLANRVETV